MDDISSGQEKEGAFRRAHTQSAHFCGSVSAGGWGLVVALDLWVILCPKSLSVDHPCRSLLCVCFRVCVCLSRVCGVFLLERVCLCLSVLCVSVWTLSLYRSCVWLFFASICVLGGFCVCMYSCGTVIVCAHLSARCLSRCLCSCIGVCFCLLGFGFSARSCLSVHRRQNTEQGKTAEPRAWLARAGGRWRVSLVITDSGAKPTPVESHDSLGSLAKEERKGQGRVGAIAPLSFSMAPLFPAASFSVLFFCKGLGGGLLAEQRVRSHSRTL